MTFSLQSIRSKRTTLLFVLLFLILGIFATIFLVKQQVDQRSRAATQAFYDSFFPVGAFDAQIPGPSELTAFINDVQPNGMDALMMNNNVITNPLHQQMLTVADQRGLNYIIGPQNELYKQWWSSTATAPATLDGAKQVAAPLVALMKDHPSLKGYNLVDDAEGQSLLKRNLMQQAFYELDGGQRPVSLINGVTLGRYDFVNNIQPRAVYWYSYPAGVGLAACDWRRGESGQRDWIDNFRIRRQFIPDNTPIFQILQTHQTEKDVNGTIVGGTSSLRYPTLEELRLQQWLALGEGATGLFWFTYNDLPGPPGTPSWTGWKNNPSFKTEIFDLSKRIQPFKSTLAQLQKIDDKFTASGGGKVYASTFKHKTENRIFVLIVNRECTQQTLTLATNYVTGELKDLETETTQAITTPLTLRGGDGKIFELVNANLITPQPTPQPITNIIQNGSFESLDATSKPLSWTVPASAVDSSISHTGSKSIKFTGPVAFSYFWQKPPVQPGKKYLLSFWVKTQNVEEKTNHGIGIRYTQTAPSAVSLEKGLQLRRTHDWTKLFTLFTVPANFTEGRLDLIVELNSGETAWIDDVEMCEVNTSCHSLGVTPLTPFTSPTPQPSTPPPSPTPVTIQSVVPGVTYQNKPWSGAELTTFMKTLSDRVITRHAKKDKTKIPELTGFIYEYMKFNPDKPWQGKALDSMHDGAWFGNALTSAFRATTDTAFSTTLNNYALTFYPNILNNSDTYFPLGLTVTQAEVSDVSQIPSPSDYPTNPVSKGIVPYWWDDGESVSLETADLGAPLIGFRAGKYTSLHMADDIAMMLSNGYKLTARQDVAAGLKNLALGNRIAYGGEGYSPAIIWQAQKLLPNDPDIKAKWGLLPPPTPLKSFSSPTTPPFSLTRLYKALYNNTVQVVPSFLDGETWTYYRALLDQDRQPLSDQHAKEYLSIAYTNIVWNQLWYADTPRQPGLDKLDVAGGLVGAQKFSPYYTDSPNFPQGSRYGPMNMFFAAVGLQLLKQFPNAWERWRNEAFPNDQKVEIRWSKPVLDGMPDDTWYGNPITIDTDVTVRLASSIDSLHLLIDRPSGKAVPLTLYSRPDAASNGATLTVAADGTITAKARNGVDDLLLTKGEKRGTRDQFEISIPYTIVKTQKIWANAVEDSRLSLKGANNTVFNLFFLSSPQTVKQILEKELLEGLRFWEFVNTDWGMIPSGFYLTKGKTGIWNGFSDTGGYAHIINAAAAYKEYLEGKTNWDLYKTVTTGSPTPTLGGPTSALTPTPSMVTVTPTRTPTPIISGPTQTPGDVNGDGNVDLLDFNIWRSEFLGTLSTKQSDFNADNVVDLLDFNIWFTEFKK